MTTRLQHWYWPAASDIGPSTATAVAICQATVQTAPHNPRAHNNLGFALAEERQNEAAINHYRQALAIDPEYTDADYNLGNAYTSFENWNEAVNH